jgi:hypothetical protein
MGRGSACGLQRARDGYTWVGGAQGRAGRRAGQAGQGKNSSMTTIVGRRGRLAPVQTRLLRDMSSLVSMRITIGRVVYLQAARRATADGGRRTAGYV